MRSKKKKKKKEYLRMRTMEAACSGGEMWCFLLSLLVGFRIRSTRHLVSSTFELSISRTAFGGGGRLCRKRMRIRGRFLSWRWERRRRRREKLAVTGRGTSWRRPARKDRRNEEDKKEEEEGKVCVRWVALWSENFVRSSRHGIVMKWKAAPAR